MDKCTKIVDVKYYQNKFLGITLPTTEFYVLADGREIRTDSEFGEWGRNGFGEICETTYKAKK